jgi:hypothetical protein
MYSEEKLDLIVNLLFGDIEEVQRTHRRIYRDKSRLYNYLLDNGYRFGYQFYHKNNTMMGGGKYMDFSVNKSDYINIKTHYFYIEINGVRNFISKDTKKLNNHDMFMAFGSMSLNDIWEHVETKITIDNRNNNIDEILSEGNGNDR